MASLSIFSSPCIPSSTCLLPTYSVSFSLSSLLFRSVRAGQLGQKPSLQRIVSATRCPKRPLLLPLESLPDRLLLERKAHLLDALLSTTLLWRKDSRNLLECMFFQNFLNRLQMDWQMIPCGMTDRGNRWEVECKNVRNAAARKKSSVVYGCSKHDCARSARSMCMCSEPNCAECTAAHSALLLIELLSSTQKPRPTA